MSRMRIVADNAASRATLAASGATGALVVSNLQIDDKDRLWRAPGTSATLTLTWGAPEVVSCVALPFCNLSPTATIRVRGYSDVAGATQVLDTGAQLACPAPARRPRGWTAAQAASAYAYGGGATACLWFAETSVRRVVIDLVDLANLQGYIEAACLVVAPYWSPKYNPSRTAYRNNDTTELYRTDAGGQGAEAGVIHRGLSIDLSMMPPADRSVFADLLRNSRAYPLLVSLYAGSADLTLERDNLVYGRRVEDSEIALEYAVAYGSTVVLEEI